MILSEEIRKIRIRVRYGKRILSSLYSFIPTVLFIPLTILLLSKPGTISDSEISAIPDGDTKQLSLIFLGDIMQHMPQVEAAWNDSLNQYVYDSTFQYLAPIISSYDIAVANLETTLAGKPYSGYPAFSSPDALALALINAGIDLVGTANNHCCDRGKTGIVRTISILDSLGLSHFGTYRSQEEHSLETPVLIHKNGIKIALLNYTYGVNGNAIPESTVVNLIDKEKIAADLETAKKSGPDKTILFIHWGDEYQREPNDYQKDIAAFCLEHGADIIIGSHPHVIQPMEWHKADSIQKENLIAWSLGNCVSNQRKQYTDGGAMIGITLKKENGKVVIQSADYQLNWVYNPIRYGKRQYYILPVKRFENDTVMMDKDSYSSFHTFINDSRELLKNNLNIPEHP